MLCLQLEMMEATWAKNSQGEAGPKSIEIYQRVTNTKQTLISTLNMSAFGRKADIPDPLADVR